LFGFNGEEMSDCWKYTISQNKWEELGGIVIKTSSDAEDL
jgi:hypothetical protein